MESNDKSQESDSDAAGLEFLPFKYFMLVWFSAGHSGPWVIKKYIATNVSILLSFLRDVVSWLSKRLHSQIEENVNLKICPYCFPMVLAEKHLQFKMMLMQLIEWLSLLQFPQVHVF